MQALRSTESFNRIDPEIRALIQQRVEELRSDAGLATFVVVEPSDGLEALDGQLGFSVLADRVSGRRFGEAGFCPSFETVESHPTCFEMVLVLADYGDGALVFVPKRRSRPPPSVALRSLCIFLSHHFFHSHRRRLRVASSIGDPHDRT